MSGLTARGLVAITDAVRPGLWSPPSNLAAPASHPAAAPISAERIAAIRAEVARHRVMRVSSAASAADHAPVVVVAAAQFEQQPSTPEGWRAEWQASAALREEFASVDAYVALRAAETAGRVKVISKAPAALSAATTPEAWRAEFFASAALRAEFATVEDYVALRKGVRDGRVKLWK